MHKMSAPEASFHPISEVRDPPRPEAIMDLDVLWWGVPVSRGQKSAC